MQTRLASGHATTTSTDEAQHEGEGKGQVVLMCTRKAIAQMRILYLGIELALRDSPLGMYAAISLVPPSWCQTSLVRGTAQKALSVGPKVCVRLQCRLIPEQREIRKFPWS